MGRTASVISIPAPSKFVVWLGKDTSHLEHMIWLYGEFIFALDSYEKKYGHEKLEKQDLFDVEFPA
jgi:hypothetical protein